MIDVTVSSESRVGIPAENLGDSHLVVAGTSHVCRLAEFLPANTVVLTVPGFKPITETAGHPKKIQRNRTVQK
jgi:hypothetical protein